MTTLASYVLAIGGMIAMLGFAIAAFQSNLKYPPAKLMIVNLLRTNPQQAAHVCASMPKTFFEALGSAIKTILQMGATTDPAMIYAASKPGFDAGAMMVGTYWKGLLLKTKMAVGAAGASIALVMSSRFPPIPVLICSIIAGLAALYVLYRKHEVDRTLMLSRAEILPEIERLFLEGRYR